MSSIEDVIRLLEAARDHPNSQGSAAPKKATKAMSKKKSTKARKPSAYSKKYSKAFKAIAPKHKKKSGGWKKDGYKKAVKASHAKARKMK